MFFKKTAGNVGHDYKNAEPSVEQEEEEENVEKDVSEPKSGLFFSSSLVVNVFCFFRWKNTRWNCIVQQFPWISSQVNRAHGRAGRKPTESRSVGRRLANWRKWSIQVNL